VPPNPPLVDPIFQYPHDPGPPCWAIIGGHVVRDPALAGLTGRYLYGDLCAQDLRTLDLGAPGADPRPAGISLPPGSGSLLSFGEDGRGCSYALTDVTVYRVAAAADAGAACPAVVEPETMSPPRPPSGTSAPPDDRRGPKLSLTARHRQPLRRIVRVSAACDEACTLSAAGSLAVSGAASSSAAAAGALLANRASAPPGVRVQLSLKLKRRPLRRASRAALRGGKISLSLLVTATDSGGNASRQPLRIKLLAPPPR
jgi:hypothetical protein